MSMEATTLIAAQTAVVATPVPYPIEQRSLPATIMATNLVGSEAVNILFSVDGGLTFEPFSQDGEELTLTETGNSLSIVAPLMIGVTKSATGVPSGVFILSNQVPNFDGFKY